MKIFMLLLLICIVGCADMKYDNPTSHPLKNGGELVYEDSMLSQMDADAYSSFQNFERDCISPCVIKEKLRWSYGIFWARYYPPDK